DVERVAEHLGELVLLVHAAEGAGDGDHLAAAQGAAQGDDVAEALGGLVGDQLHGDAALLGEDGRVDVADLLGDHRAEHSAQRGELQRGDVAGGDLAVHLDVEHLGRLPRQRGEQLTEPVRERHSRADQVVDRAAGDVDRVGDELAGQGQAHGLRDRDAGLLLRLGGGGAQVRGEGDVVELEELRGRPALGGRLGGVHVQRGGRDPAGGERVV